MKGEVRVNYWKNKGFSSKGHISLIVTDISDKSTNISFWPIQDGGINKLGYAFPQHEKPFFCPFPELDEVLESNLSDEQRHILAESIIKPYNSHLENTLLAHEEKVEKWALETMSKIYGADFSIQANPKPSSSNTPTTASQLETHTIQRPASRSLIEEKWRKTKNETFENRSDISCRLLYGSAMSNEGAQIIRERLKNLIDNNILPATPPTKSYLLKDLNTIEMLNKYFLYVHTMQLGKLSWGIWSFFANLTNPKQRAENCSSMAGKLLIEGGIKEFLNGFEADRLTIAGFFNNLYRLQNVLRNNGNPKALSEFRHWTFAIYMNLKGLWLLTIASYIPAYNHGALLMAYVSYLSIPMIISLKKLRLLKILTTTKPESAIARDYSTTIGIISASIIAYYTYQVPVHTAWKVILSATTSLLGLKTSIVISDAVGFFISPKYQVTPASIADMAEMAYKNSSISEYVSQAVNKTKGVTYIAQSSVSILIGAGAGYIAIAAKANDLTKLLVSMICYTLIPLALPSELASIRNTNHEDEELAEGIHQITNNVKYIKDFLQHSFFSPVLAKQADFCSNIFILFATLFYKGDSSWEMLTIFLLSFVAAFSLGLNFNEHSLLYFNEIKALELNEGELTPLLQEHDQSNSVNNTP